jgi:spore coat polysaccharide biosynthesis predicted glycosyltransferase SpsG
MIMNTEQEDSINKGAVLAVPACEPGRGGGHLVRCMALVRGLRNLDREAWLFAPNIIDTGYFDRDWLITDENGLPHTNWECIVLDRFQTPSEELARWEKLAPVIGIDEGGSCRNDFDFLVDILPNCSRKKPNIADPSLLPLPKKNEECEESNNQRKKILVSFGHEDSAGLGMAVAEALAAINSNIEVTLLQGKLSILNLPPPPPPPPL